VILVVLGGTPMSTLLTALASQPPVTPVLVLGHYWC
jgi:hypothetical protein